MTTWRTATWAELVEAAQALGPAGDVAYFRCYDLLRADRSMLGRAEHATELVRFLNAWRCRLDSRKGPPAFEAWIRAHATELEALADTAITDPAVPEIAGAVDELYASLIGLRSELRNLGDAAASKAFHQLLPDLVVMWDKAVAQWAVAQGCESYGGFLVAMHELAVRVLEEAGLDLEAAEAQLRERLGYPARKPLAKTLDEANIRWVSSAAVR